MISVKIRDHNLALGAPEDAGGPRLECETLFLRRETKDGHPVMLSAWKPSAAELQSLILGGSIILGVVGPQHPPVLMYVSEED